MCNRHPRITGRSRGRSGSFLILWLGRSLSTYRSTFLPPLLIIAEEGRTTAQPTPPHHRVSVPNSRHQSTMSDVSSSPKLKNICRWIMHDQLTPTVRCHQGRSQQGIRGQRLSLGHQALLGRYCDRRVEPCPVLEQGGGQVGRKGLSGRIGGCGEGMSSFLHRRRGSSGPGKGGEEERLVTSGAMLLAR